MPQDFCRTIEHKAALALTDLLQLLTTNRPWRYQERGFWAIRRKV